MTYWKVVKVKDWNLNWDIVITNHQPSDCQIQVTKIRIFMKIWFILWGCVGFWWLRLCEQCNILLQFPFSFVGSFQSKQAGSENPTFLPPDVRQHQLHRHNIIILFQGNLSFLVLRLRKCSEVSLLSVHLFVTINLRQQTQSLIGRSLSLQLKTAPTWLLFTNDCHKHLLQFMLRGNHI